MATLVNQGSMNHGMLGLQDWPTQEPAGGSPLFCFSLLRGCKCSTSPLSVHEMFAVQQQKTSGTLLSPWGPPGGREELLFVSLSYLISRLSPSPSCMSPATWEGKAENERQMGEANGNFSILFSSLGNKIGIH